MPTVPHSSTSNDASAQELNPAQLVDLVAKQEREIVNLKRQVAWFQRQIFGQKSEKRLPEPDGVQGVLGMGFDAVSGTPLPGMSIVGIKAPPIFGVMAPLRAGISGAQTGVQECAIWRDFAIAFFAVFARFLGRKFFGLRGGYARGWRRSWPGRW